MESSKLHAEKNYFWHPEFSRVFLLAQTEIHRPTMMSGQRPLPQVLAVRLFLPMHNAAPRQGNGKEIAPHFRVASLRPNAYQL